jgi:hypothetical protein
MVVLKMSSSHRLSRLDLGPRNVFRGRALLRGLGPQHLAVVNVKVRSRCRFRYRGTEYARESGIKWMSDGAKRQSDRALAAPAGPCRTARAENRRNGRLSALRAHTKSAMQNRFAMESAKER